MRERLPATYPEDEQYNIRQKWGDINCRERISAVFNECLDDYDDSPDLAYGSEQVMICTDLLSDAWNEMSAMHTETVNWRCAWAKLEGLLSKPDLLGINDGSADVILAHMRSIKDKMK
ncbi:MAG: hypothetical protein GOVbin2833_14 [Prokaryotic dsDNA virus sp.]|nr:MAG: hypothetical protein GOVbin2833_14 [Prokaryotic dsDNA virus sp.]|tara:strand:+ start:16466 stop:16819 length:354 start_codon:yes stop_codon:yes gene_type:complete